MDLETGTQSIFNREFVLCCLNQGFFSLVFSILIPTLPIYLSRFEAREAEIGFLIGIFSISSLLFRPLIGKALLKVPEKRFMMAGAIVYVLSSIAYLLAPPFWPLLIVRIVQGIGMAFFSTAIFTWVARITPVTHRGQLVSYFYLAGSLAFALGPYLGMVLINQFSFPILFFVCAGFSLCCVAITANLRNRTIPLLKSGRPEVETLLSREAIAPSVIAFSLNLVWGTLTAFIPLYALGHGISNPGVFFIFLAITLVLGRMLGGRLLDVYDKKKVVFSCLATVVVSLILFPFAKTLSRLIFVGVVLGTGWAFVYPSLMIFAIEQAGPVKGPAMATFTALADLGAGIGPMIMGAILQWTSYPIMFSCLILTGIINLPYFHCSIGKKRLAPDIP